MANGISYLVYYSHPRTKKIPSLFVTADTHVADTLISITFFSLIVFIRIIMAKKKNDEQVWRLIPIVFLHSRLINNNVFVFASSGPGRLVCFFLVLLASSYTVWTVVCGEIIVQSSHKHAWSFSLFFHPSDVAETESGLALINARSHYPNCFFFCFLSLSFRGYVVLNRLLSKTISIKLL